mgnify:CR=1 FL=1
MVKSNMLREFIERGDLRGMVFPEFGIDMYDSKIGEQADVIVVDFVVRSESAGEDIVSFMNSSVIELLDIEVSPAPDEDGFYRVFLEYSRDIHFPEKLLGFLTELVRLTDKLKWKVRNYYAEDNETPVEFTLDVFLQIPLSPEEFKKTESNTDEIK